MLQRSGLKPNGSLDDRLAQEALRLRETARLLPAGHERERAVRQARQAETAIHINAWLRSPGLAPPA